MPEWNRFNYPNLFEEEKLFKDYCFKKDITFKIKVHKDGHCLDVNGERYLSYQDFLKLHTDYKPPSESTTRSRRAIVRYEDLEFKKKRAPSVNSMFSLESVRSPVQTQESNPSIMFAQASVNSEPTGSVGTPISQIISEVSGSATVSETDFFKPYFFTFMKRFLDKMKNSRGVNRQSVQLDVPIIRKSWFFPDDYKPRIISSLVDIGGEILVSPSSEISSSKTVFVIKPKTFKDLLVYEFNERTPKLHLKLSILLESEDVCRRSYVYRNMTNKELEKNISKVLYKKFFEEKKPEVLIKAGIQSFTFFLNDIVLAVDSDVTITLAEIGIFNLNQDGKYSVTNETINLEDMRD